MHDGQTRTQAQVQDELQKTVLSRKRKLCELYAITTSKSPQPAPQSPTSEPPDSALSHFLNQNDIESGRYFNESSLPPRPKVEWLPLSPPQEQDDAAQVDEAEFSTAPSHSPKYANRSRLASPQSSGRRGSGRPTPEDGIITQHAEAELPNGSIPTPRSAVEPDDSARSVNDLTRPAFAPRHEKVPSNAATPHSPPDSPRSQYLDADDAPVAPIASNTVRVQEEDQEIADDDGESSQQRQGSAPPPVLAPDIQTFEQSQREDEKPRKNTKASGRGASLPPQPSPKARNQGRVTSTRTSPRKTPDRYFDRSDLTVEARQKDSRPSVTRDSVARATSKQPTPDRLLASREQPTSPAPEPHHREPLRDMDNVQAGMKHGLDDAEDPWKPNAKRMKREKPAVVVKLAKADRYVPAARYQRFAGGQDYRHPGGKKDYMHILFLRQALDSGTTFKTDLGNLLGSTSKTLTTSDWEASLHEKHECAVVKRVYDWQQKGVWSLRQPKPYPEPPRPPSHWDHLIAEAKWLQTDFREERKLKLSVCQEMAHWCKEWYEASFPERVAMQVRNDSKVSRLGLEDELPDAPRSEDLGVSAPSVPRSTLEDVFDPEASIANLLDHESLDHELLEKLPLYEPWKVMAATDQSLSITADMQRMADIAAAGDGSSDEAPAPEIPPEETACAIFDPAWKQLRTRVNANMAFKMPTTPMPPTGFYEHRRASQWTPQDDHQLKQFAKDFPSNWSLISDRLTSRTQFTPSINRRTPWECYERLLSMEGVNTDPNMRQYARQFTMTLERIRQRWQHSVQQSLQQQGLQQQLQHPPRFPAPLKVERNMPSRRFACILDGARKIAKKRENAESQKRITQENQTQAQRANGQVQPQQAHNPQYWSAMKAEREEQIRRRNQQHKQQQIAMLQQQQANAKQANQPLYNSGLSQRTGSRGTDVPQSATTANGHLAVPGMNAHRGQASQAMQMPPNPGQTNAQLAAQMAGMQGRPQTGVQMQRGLAPGFNGNQQMSEQNMMLAQQQQHLRQQQQAQLQRQQMNQNQGSHGSPNMGNVNGVPNGNNMNQFSNTNGDSMQSPRLPQGDQSNSNQTSPNLAQQMMAQFGGGRPHQLSSGHVPLFESLRHKIAQENPQLSESDVMNLVTSHLQKGLNSSSTSNNVNYAQNRALNAAAGMHQMPQQQQQQQQRPQTGQGMPNPSQSPYPNNQQSPYMNNAMLAARSASPANPLQQQQNYGQSMHSQISQQMRRNGVNGANGMMLPGAPPGSAGGGSNPASSPPMANAMMQGGMYGNGPARTPTPGQAQMRPPSSAMERPGSANAFAMQGMGSPRPVSSQGVQ